MSEFPFVFLHPLLLGMDLFPHPIDIEGSQIQSSL